uniref:Uncharacterized protein n=1 Tax=Anopheles farauti TaxID=69004 RepID=A0A182R051_9DIPT
MPVPGRLLLVLLLLTLRAAGRKETQSIFSLGLPIGPPSSETGVVEGDGGVSPFCSTNIGEEDVGGDHYLRLAAAKDSLNARKTPGAASRVLGKFELLLLLPGRWTMDDGVE